MSEKRIFILIFLLLLNYGLSGQEIIKMESNVISATVFTETAVVTREAKVNIPSTGEYILVFSSLTANFQDETVKISGKGTAKVKIIDVKTETNHTTEINDKQLKREQEKIDSIKLSEEIINDRISVLESQKSYIESLRRECAKEINDELASGKQNIKEWQNKYSFFNLNLTNTYNDLRNENITKKKITDQIRTIEENIKKFRTEHDKSYKEIFVTVISEQPGNLTLQASFSVYDASWEPVYDARIFPDKKNLEFSYYGMIRQNTGEDWKNVNLTLSTSKPLSNEVLPELDPLYLNISNTKLKGRQIPKANSSEIASGFATDPVYKFNGALQPGFGSIEGLVFDNTTGEQLVGANIIVKGTSIGAAANFDGYYYLKSIPAGKYKVICSYIGYKPLEADIIIRDREALTVSFYLNAEEIAGELIEVTAQAQGRLDFIEPQKKELPVKFSEVELNSKETFSTFVINSKCNIPSDNQSHKVHITTQPMDVSLEYRSVPKLSLNAYLICKTANKKDFTLTAGDINLFLEDEYINKYRIQNVAPGDTFDIYTGTDKDLKTEKKVINRFTESKGLLNGKTSITYEYEIITTNSTASEQKVTIQDQLPISQNEDIVVEVLEPDEAKLNINKEKIITWKLNLKPGERKIIPFKYRVIFPSGKNIVGLE